MSRLRQFTYWLAPLDRLDYRVLVFFCLASTVVLAPIAANYYRVGLTGVSLGIGGLAAGYALLGCWILHVRRTVPYNFLLAFVATIATLVPVRVLGTVAVPWIHPLILVNYYLLPRRVALGVNVFASVILLILVSGSVNWTGISHQASVLAAVMFFAHVFVWAIDRQQRELRRQSREDPLTGLGNRRALETALQHAVARFQRSGRPLSLIMLDLDHFKRINDAFGHARGDEAIRIAADMIRHRLRKGDAVLRFGGEEFVILCENTDNDGAVHLAERLRHAARSELVIGELPITLSAGVATLHEEESGAECLERADLALLAAKSAGRDRVHIADSGPDEDYVA